MITTSNIATRKPGDASITQARNMLKAMYGDTVKAVMLEGAVGDGATNDGPVIQAAIDAVYAAGGGQVLFPAKSFRTNQTILLKPYVQLIGVGYKTKILSYVNEAIKGDDSLGNLQRSGMDYITIVNMTGSTNVSAVGLSLNSTKLSNFRNIEFENYDEGNPVKIAPTLQSVSAPGIDNINFVFNRFVNFYATAVGDGVILDGGRSLASATNVITHNRFEDFTFRYINRTGILHRKWNDNDYFEKLYLNAARNSAACVYLSEGNTTAYVGIGGHHYVNLTVVRDNTTAYSDLYGVRMNNADYNKIDGLTSDFSWPATGKQIFNPLGRPLQLTAHYLYSPSGSDRMAEVTFGGANRKRGKVIASAGNTSVVINIPGGMMKKPKYVSLNWGSSPPPPWPPVFNESTVSASSFTALWSTPLSANTALYWEAETSGLPETNP